MARLASESTPPPFSKSGAAARPPPISSEVVDDTRSMRRDLPTGTVTFLFTDIENFTRLLRRLGPDVYAEALAESRASPMHHGHGNWRLSAESPCVTKPHG
jgi:hypothetical protein